MNKIGNNNIWQQHRSHGESVAEYIYSYASIHIILAKAARRFIRKKRTKKAYMIVLIRKKINDNKNK